MAEIAVGTQIGQQAFGIRFGKPELTSINVVVCSLTAGTVSIVVDGVGTTDVALADPAQAIGTDNTGTKPQAGFVNNATISGLTAYTKYTYTATQNGTSYIGSFWTAPEADDDFILMPISCDNNGTTMQAGPTPPPGGYGHIRTIAEANPDKAMYIVHMDDHYGYLDLTRIDDSAVGGTGHVSSAAAGDSAKVYDYSIAAFNAFGLYSDVADGKTPNSQTSDSALWGKHEDYIWCMRNIPVLPQWGDHDCGIDEMGWAHLPTDAVGSPSPKERFDNCTAVWNAFLDPFRGTAIDGSNSKAWEHALGCVKIIAPDGITKGSGDGVKGNVTSSPTWSRPTTVWGATQITNLIDACDDSSVPFKIMLMNYGIRFLYDETLASQPTLACGSQNPLGGNETFVNGLSVEAGSAHADYAALFTAANGIMSKNSCNGVLGQFMTVHGDDHRGMILENRNTAGVVDEYFTSIHIGTVTGSANFDNTNPVTNVGVPVDGSTAGFLVGAGAGDSEFIRNYFVSPMFVYGSRPLKEIEVEYYERGGRRLWNKKFVQSRGGNEPHDVDVDFVFKSNSSSVAGGIDS